MLRKKVKMSTSSELRRLKWAVTDKVDIFNFFSWYGQSLLDLTFLTKIDLGLLKVPFDHKLRLQHEWLGS